MAHISICFKDASKLNNYFAHYIATTKRPTDYTGLQIYLRVISKIVERRHCQFSFTLHSISVYSHSTKQFAECDLLTEQNTVQKTLPWIADIRIKFQSTHISTNPVRTSKQASFIYLCSAFERPIPMQIFARAVYRLRSTNFAYAEENKKQFNTMQSW